MGVCDKGKKEFDCGKFTVKSIPHKTRAYRGIGRKMALCEGDRELASFTLLDHGEAVNIADWKSKVKGKGYGKQLLRCFIDTRDDLYFINTDGFTEIGYTNFKDVAEEEDYRIVDWRIGKGGGGYARLMRQDVIDYYIEEQEKTGKSAFIGVNPEFHSRNNPVTVAITDWIKQEKIDPYEINCGRCEDLAEYVEDKVTGAESIWVDSLIEGREHIRKKLEDCTHAVIRYKNKFYDAETPQGVRDIQDLPIIKNKDDKKYHECMHKKHQLFK